MTYKEIVTAILQGKTVHWSNEGYIVLHENNRLYSIFTRNEWMCGLQEREYQDCFIGVTKC